MKSYRILSLEARNIYVQERAGKKGDYRLPPETSEKYFDQFRNILDESLDTKKLRGEYEKITGGPFSFRDKFGNEYTKAIINVQFKKGIEKVMSILELRAYYYEKGFCVDGVRYVRYKRSAGSSRSGKCLFIDERLYGIMAEWSECGLTAGRDVASWEAYKSLSLSAVKKFINIPIEGILFVDDKKFPVKEEVVSVEFKGKELVAEEKVAEIHNDIWDGESLLDESLFTVNYPNRHMLLLRNKFFKSCAFRTKLQKWIRDKGITLDDLKARGFVTLATDISQIVMVTTPNSLKYLKFVGGLSEDNVRKWASHVESDFGVVKYDKRTRFFGGKMVSSSYQLLNTIGLNEAQVDEVLKPSKDYLTEIWRDIDLMRYHFIGVCKKEESDDGDDEWEDEWEQDDERGGASDGLEQRAEMLFSLINTNSDFQHTWLYEQFRLDVRQAQEKLMTRGRILLHGTNATLFGNGPELLRHIAGESIESGTLKAGEIWCKRFKDGQKLLCARSPHITMGNLYCVTNRHEGDIWNYFDLGDNIVCVNAIGENVQQRLNGCDYDSDTMLITDDEILIKTVEDRKRECGFLFKVPVCQIASKGTVNFTTAEVDYNTSMNKIGEIVNLSQKLNSIIWHVLNGGDGEINSGNTDIGKVYLDVCKLAVLSGLEIDKAKRAYDEIDVRYELAKIRNNYPKSVPEFFKLITKKEEGGKDKEKKEKAKKEYKFHKTSMEYICKSASRIDYRKNKAKHAKHVTVLSLVNAQPQDNDEDVWACKMVCDALDKYSQRVNFHRMKIRFADDDEKKWLYAHIRDIKKERDEEILKLIPSLNVLLITLKSLEDSGTKNTSYYDPLLCTTMFLDIVNESEEKLATVEYDPSGKICLHGFNHSKR